MLHASMCRYKFALLEARLTLASLLQSYTFNPAPGLPETKWHSGIVNSPDCLWSLLDKREARTERDVKGLSVGDATVKVSAAYAQAPAAEPTTAKSLLDKRETRADVLWSRDQQA